MASFFGNYDHSVDANGRVNIPAKFRKELLPEDEERFFVTCGPKNNLWIYPKTAWFKRVAQLKALPDTPKNLSLKQMIFGNMNDSTLDAQKRIVLTLSLMKHAGIGKEVTLVGMANYIELWDTAKYKECQEAMSASFDDAFFEAEAELGGIQ
ncbi:MAG: division/cell wall cluster transcriptional repressor MraZ [Chitinispirillia bacterium]|nr:division/cell wall cluster transcriptional repressor MraZ [Chitinispirillia bacterium]